MIPFIFLIVILSYCHGFVWLTLASFSFYGAYGVLGVGFAEGYGSIRTKRMEKDADTGIGKSASQMGEQTTGSSRTGVGLGLSDLVMEACFTELLFPMRHKELCG